MPHHHHHHEHTKKHHCVHKVLPNPALTVANQLTHPPRFTSLCACNVASSLCRSHVACQKWCPPNSTCHKCAPPISCQFCYYNVKHCPTKCHERKCRPTCCKH